MTNNGLESKLRKSEIRHKDDSGNDTEHSELLRQLQGNILRGHGRDHVRLVFLRVKKKDPARRTLRKFCEEKLTSAFQQEEEHIEHRKHPEKKGKLFAGVFLTNEGYMALGIEEELIPQHEVQDFRRERKLTMDLLNDPEIITWDEAYRTPFHVMILLAHEDEKELETALKKLQAAHGGFGDLTVESGNVLREKMATPEKRGRAREHFGFAEGQSQPLFFEDDIEADRASQNGAPGKYPGEAPLNLVLVKDPANPHPEACGSYLVFRKLEQHVELFETLTQNMAAKLGVSQKEAKGLVMGRRFPTGGPLTLEKADGEKFNNSFNYDSDRKGQKCPSQAHIRRANRREPETAGRRIVRRGISYGPEVPDRGRASPSVSSSAGKPPERGLLFMCFQSKIANQFEAIQTQANASHQGFDPIIGQIEKKNPPPDDEIRAAQSWPVNGGESNMAEFFFWGKERERVVKLRGSEYFFAPSVGFLKGL